jgi:uncharacterized membrane protein HdeD (DUF308 family)
MLSRPVLMALGLVALALPYTAVCTLPKDTLMYAGVTLLVLGYFGIWDAIWMRFSPM